MIRVFASYNLPISSDWVDLLEVAIGRSVLLTVAKIHYDEVRQMKVPGRPLQRKNLSLRKMKSQKKRR